MKKFFISLFLVLSVFITVSCFVSVGSNKPFMSFQVVLKELKNSNISFDIENDISEVSTSLKNLDLNSSFKNGDVLGCLEGIGKTLYYGARFFVKMIVHTFISALNICIVVLRCIGFTSLNYIHPWSSSPYIDGIEIINPGNPFESGNRGSI